MHVLLKLCGVTLIAVTMGYSCALGHFGLERTRPPVEAAVYAALIEALVRPQADTLVFSDSTIAFPVPAGGFRRLQPQFDSMPLGLSARLYEVSATLRPTSTLALPQPVRVLTRVERDEIFAGGPRVGWEEFHRRFPKQRQWLEFSPVAFSADSGSALVYYRHHCGPRCGGGSAVWLKLQKGGRWEVRKVVGLWAS